MIGHSLGGLVATRYAQRPDHGLTALVLSAPAVGANPDLLGLVELPEFPEIPIDPSVLSRDSEVGRRYAEDPLVYHGPLLKPTLLALIASAEAVAAGEDFGELPTLWLHGEEDFLVPLAAARPLVERVGGNALEQKVYAGARHEIFNETNRDEVIADAVAFIERAL
jgi:alpha-beta hydrolase superfamily lysophospholipase